MNAVMGTTLHSADLPMDEIVRYVQECEAVGYEGFWLTEESAKEAFAVLALLARETRRIRLATAILSFYSRTPTLLAMGAATIWRLSGGRFALGIGTGGIGFMERGHGIPIERPLALARESTEIIRGLLTSKRFSYEGRRFHVRDFHLREGPIDGTLPIYLSALNPKMVATAAEVADGIIANWPSEEAIEEFRSIIARAASQAGRAPEACKILTLLMTGVDCEEEGARDAMRRAVAFYCASKHYHHIAQISGFGPQAAEVQAVWETGDFARATRLVSDAMVEKFTLTGSFADCRKKLRWLLDSGIYPIIYPVPRHDRMVEDHFAGIRLAAKYLS